MLVTLLENLINKKFYTEKQEILTKLDVFYAMSKISDEEYSNFTLKVEEVYRIEETVENTKNTATEEEVV